MEDLVVAILMVIMWPTTAAHAGACHFITTRR
jgi:hypothetical protein